MRVNVLAEYLGPGTEMSSPGVRLQLDITSLRAREDFAFSPAFLDELCDVLQVQLTQPVPDDGKPVETDMGVGLESIPELFNAIYTGLHTAAGLSVAFEGMPADPQAGCYQFLYATHEHAIARIAARLALRVLVSGLPARLHPDDWPETRFSLRRSLRDFDSRVRELRIGEISSVILSAAEARNIPWLRCSADLPFVQVGHGRHRQVFANAVTSGVGFIGHLLCRNKSSAIALLGSSLVPVPRHSVVGHETAAALAAGEIGYPVVVKPVNLGGGKGISVGLDSEEQVRKAFREAARYGEPVAVEEFVPGRDYRLLVIGGEMIAAARRDPASVVGDGEHTIRQLIDILNREQDRRAGSQFALAEISYGPLIREYLARQGYDGRTVPGAGEAVQLVGTANISSGGTAVDVTDEVHPDNKSLVERAARTLGLGIAGVDLIITDISRSWREVGGKICELNDSVGLRPHWQSNQGRDIVGPLLDTMIPQGSQGRIPIAAITGTSGKTTTAHMLDKILSKAGLTVGLATSNGAFIGGKAMAEGDLAGAVAAQAILRDVAVEAAVLETARGGIVRRGLGYGTCDVAAVLNVTADHLGEYGIDTVEAMAEVKALVAQSAREWVVLNADDPACVGIGRGLHGARVCYVSEEPGNDSVVEHVAGGGRAVIMDKSRPGLPITLIQGEIEIQLCEAKRIPATAQGMIQFNCTNALFAASLAYCMNVPPADIDGGLQDFSNDFEDSPGRANVFCGNGFTVVLDNAHNPAKFRALAKWMTTAYSDARKTLVFGVPGNRQDSIAGQVAAEVASTFDQFYCTLWGSDPRGRELDGMQNLLRDALLTEGVPAQAVEICGNQSEGLRASFDAMQAGEVVVICCREHLPARQMIQSFLSNDSEQG